MASSGRGDLRCLIYPPSSPLLSISWGHCTTNAAVKALGGCILCAYCFSRVMVIGVLLTVFAFILCAMTIIWEIITFINSISNLTFQSICFGESCVSLQTNLRTATAITRVKPNTNSSPSKIIHEGHKSIAAMILSSACPSLHHAMKSCSPHPAGTIGGKRIS